MRLTKLFIAAAIGAMSVSAAASPASIVVPFDPRSDEVTIIGTIAGHQLHFFVDSAVDPSVLDLSAATQLGLKRRGSEGAIEGVGSDQVTAYESALPNFNVAGRPMRSVDILVTDMSQIKARYGAPLDGVLGYSFLKDHAVVIDYPANRLTVFDGSAGKLSQRCARTYVFPLSFQSADEKIILVPGLTIGGVAVGAFLDTGSSGSLTVVANDPTLGRVKAMLPRGKASTGVGARGQVAMRRGRLAVTTRLGPFRVKRASVALASAVPGGPPVNIGNAFLRTLGARLLIDVPGKRVGLFAACR